MLFIDLEELEPHIRHLIPALEEAHAAIMLETDPDARAALIKKHSSKWTALREAFDHFSNGKCWYVECKCSGALDDLDHFRPKLGVAEDKEHPGYYWRAFKWRNLRLSSQRANRPGVNLETDETEGKGTHFPLLSQGVRARRPEDDLSLEFPALLDPTNPADPVLLTFKTNGEVDLSPEFRGQDWAEKKFETSRLYLYLNWSKFVDDRARLYTKIKKIVIRGKRQAPRDFMAAQTTTTAHAFWDAIRDLRSALSPREVYSAAARVYVESFRDEWWIRDIVLRHPR
jgi:hypothetical protein